MSVSGLGPPVYLLLIWRFRTPDGSVKGWPQAPLAFLFSFLSGLVFGVLYTVATTKNSEGGLQYPNVATDLAAFRMGEGPYSLLLGINVIGHAVCLFGCILGKHRRLYTYIYT